MDLFYRKLGKGAPLIILHGLYGSSDNWFSIGKALAKWFTVYLVNQRNHGQSFHHNDHNYFVLREDLLRFIEINQISKPIVLGHSMGGKTAMFFAAEYPEILSAMVVIDIAPKTYNERDEVNPGFLQHSHIVSILASFPVNEINTREEADKEMAKYIRPPRIRQFLLKNLKRDKNGKFIWGMNIEAIKNNLEAIYSGLEKTLVKENDIPALFVKGELSDYLLEKDFENITKLFPNVEIKEIQGAGHWLHVEKPEEFLKIVYDFFQKNELIS